MVELAGVEQLVARPARHPEMQPVRAPHQPVQVHAHGLRCRRRQRAAVDLRQHRRRPASARTSNASSRQRNSPPSAKRAGHCLQPSAAIVAHPPFRRRARQAAQRCRSAGRTQPTRAPPKPNGSRAARQHGVVAGGDVAQQVGHATGIATIGVIRAVRPFHRAARHRHMRVHEAAPTRPLPRPLHARNGFQTIRSLLPYLWPQGRHRRAGALVAAAVLLVLPRSRPSTSRSSTAAPSTRWRRRTTSLAIPFALIVGYALLRVASAGLRRDARRGVRRRAAAHRPQGGAADLRASAPAVAALPPRPPDRRPVARDRARHRRHRERAAPGGVQHPADPARGAAGHRASCGSMFDWRFAAGHVRARSSLYIAFTFAFTNWRVQFRRDDERDRQRGADQGDRQPAELRDGQVFRQRGARGAALRRRARALRARGGQKPGHAQHAQPRPGGDHRDRPRPGHADGGRRRAGRHA